MNRSIQPAVNQLSTPRLPEPETSFLSNGIKVVLFNAGTQDLVRIEVIFKAGSWYQAHNFTALATNLMLREGTEQYSSKQISGLLDFYGAHLETTAERDNAYITLYTLNKYLLNTLPILEDIVKHASFPEDEFKIFAGKQRQMLQVNLGKVNFLARTRFNSLLYGKEHPYGNYLVPEDIDNFDITNLKSFYTNNYQSDLTIMVAGKIPEALPALLENAFGGNSANIPRPNGKDISGISSSLKNHFISKPGSVQSAIRIGRLMFNHHHPDFKGMRVLSTLLGGYFGSRLMTNIREDKGFTYGIGSAVVPLLRSGYFFISCEVGAEVTREAIAEIKRELSRLCDTPVSEKELKLVRNYMLGSFLRSIDGPFAMADTYRDIMENGLGNEFQHALLEVIRNITPAELRDLACKYLDPSEMHQLVVGEKFVE